MSWVRSTTTVAIFAAVFAMPVISPAPFAAEERPQIVTSDTPEYCFHLHDRISRLMDHEQPPPPAQAAALTAEGERLCEQGQARPGILRLRRALHLMLDGAPPHTPPGIVSIDPE